MSTKTEKLTFQRTTSTTDKGCRPLAARASIMASQASLGDETRRSAPRDRRRPHPPDGPLEMCDVPRRKARLERPELDLITTWTSSGGGPPYYLLPCF